MVSLFVFKFASVWCCVLTGAAVQSNITFNLKRERESKHCHCRSITGVMSREILDPRGSMLVSTVKLL